MCSHDGRAPRRGTNTRPQRFALAAGRSMAAAAATRLPRPGQTPGSRVENNPAPHRNKGWSPAALRGARTHAAWAEPRLPAPSEEQRAQVPAPPWRPGSEHERRHLACEVSPLGRLGPSRQVGAEGRGKTAAGWIRRRRWGSARGTIGSPSQSLVAPSRFES